MLFHQFKKKIEFRILRQRLEILFERDLDGFKFIMKDRPDWPGQYHYWHWLGAQTDDYLEWWIDLNLGRNLEVN